MESITCPVCFSYVYVPYSCENGHHLCQDCHRRVDKCPICRSTNPRKEDKKRLSKLKKLLDIPCINADEGCTVTGRLKEMTKHVYFCPKTVNTCVVSGCGWEGNVSAMVEHVYAKHGDMFLKKFTQHKPGTEFFMVMQGKYLLFGSSRSSALLVFEFLCLNNRKFAEEKRITISQRTCIHRSYKEGRGLTVDCCPHYEQNRRLPKDYKIKIESLR